MFDRAERRQQKVFKTGAFAGHEDRLRALVDAQPDRTLEEPPRP